jgi:hypothetical protein
VSWEAWGDGDDGFDSRQLFDAGWWGPDDVADVKKRIVDLAQEPLYENGRKEDGVSVRFLMRLTLLKQAAGLDVPEQLASEARAALEVSP